MELNTTLFRKEPRFETRLCKVEKILELNGSDFVHFKENLLKENDTGQDAVHEEAFPEEDMDDIAMIYKELSEEDRILLSLKYEGCHTSKEIGAVIGISPSLVRMRLSRITEKLR